MCFSVLASDRIASAPGWEFRAASWTACGGRCLACRLEADATSALLSSKRCNPRSLTAAALTPLWFQSAALPSIPFQKPEHGQPLGHDVHAPLPLSQSHSGYSSIAIDSIPAARTWATPGPRCARTLTSVSVPFRLLQHCHRFHSSSQNVGNPWATMCTHPYLCLNTRQTAELRSRFGQPSYPWATVHRISVLWSGVLSTLLNGKLPCKGSTAMLTRPILHMEPVFKYQSIEIGGIPITKS